MKAKPEKLVIIGITSSLLLLAVVLVAGFSGCFQRNSTTELALDPQNELESETEAPETISATATEAEDLTELPTETPTRMPTSTPTVEPTVTNTPQPTLEPTAKPLSGPFGPDPGDFPAGMSMLTGELVDDPTTLDYRPALVSITNWPISARPQAGLGSASLVYELYIGEGMSRFLALFYGNFPSSSTNNGDGEGDDSEDDLAIDNTNADAIGPIRSGRLPYEGIRRLNNGFLVMASAFSGVSQNLEKVTNISGSDEDDLNSATISADRLEEIAASYEGTLLQGSLSGNMFDTEAPEGGQAADTFWYIYNRLNQIAWKYDPEAGAYYRYADQADGATFVRLTDAMNGDDVDISNVILLFANHRSCSATAFDVDLMGVSKNPAVVFRDGQAYEIFWTTRNGDFERETGTVRPIRFFDANGVPFPLKPGASWIILTPLQTPIWEAPLVEHVNLDELVWLPENPDLVIHRLLNNKETGSSIWVSRFYQSLMIPDPAVCVKID
jgi:hypothetical protein